MNAIHTGAVSAVRTTKIFCRPGCPARPHPENVETLPSFAEALIAGYRPCLRCHPVGRPAPDAEIVHVTTIPTTLGPMVAAATDTHLVLLEFARRRMMRTQFLRLAQRLKCGFRAGANQVIEETRSQLAAYFAGRRRAFDIPLRVPGTPFQSRVWEVLRRIPAGATRSYAEVARDIGQPSAVRAVARANGDNRVAIIIPCHRVIGSDGSLTGYGGGLDKKQALLELEGAL